MLGLPTAPGIDRLSQRRRGRREPLVDSWLAVMRLPQGFSVGVETKTKIGKLPRAGAGRLTVSEGTIKLGYPMP